MNEEHITDDPEVLALDILAAFGNPTYDQLREAARQRISELQSKVGSWTIVKVTEEEDWLSAIVESVEPAAVVRRFNTPVSIPMAMCLLPFMMTVPTDTRWKLGRGALDCWLCIDEKRNGYLVDEVLSKGSVRVQKVVCRYVRFCAEHWEDEAVISWNRFWRERYETLVSDDRQSEIGHVLDPSIATDTRQRGGD